MMLLLMYILKFSESGAKKFAGPPNLAQNPIGGSTVTPLTENILPECKTVFPVTLESIRVNSRIHRSLWLSVT